MNTTTANMPVDAENAQPPQAGGQGIVQAMANLDVCGLTNFKSKGPDQSSNWKKWKRAFNLYLNARGVTNPNQQVALLLHMGGLELQEIYYTLVAEEEQKTLAESFQILDQHFTAQVNIPFERHCFRQLRQEKGETVDAFVCRLKQKSVSCDF